MLVGAMEFLNTIRVSCLVLFMFKLKLVCAPPTGNGRKFSCKCYNSKPGYRRNGQWPREVRAACDNGTAFLWDLQCFIFFLFILLLENKRHFVIFNFIKGTASRSFSSRHISIPVQYTKDWF